MIYLVLLLFPIAYGIYGIVKDELPVTGKRSLHGQDCRRFSKLFIAIPVLLGIGTMITVFLIPRFVASTIPNEVGFYMIVIILPLSLGIVLDRAQKTARRAMYRIPPKVNED